MKKKTVIIILSIVLLLILVRIFVLPPVVLNYCNKTLANMDGYFGHVDDIDLTLYRGAYKLKNIYINKLDSATGRQTEYFKSKVVDLSIEWKPLFRGRVVGEMEFTEPGLIYTRKQMTPAETLKDTATYEELRKKLIPLKINHFEVKNGTVHYIDSTTTPKVNIKMEQVHIHAHNLKNVRDTAELPSSLEAEAVLSGGKLKVAMKLNALADSPAFDLNAELQNTNLKLLNDIFKAYGKFDVNSGTFGLYMELASQEEKFVGYFKPVIKNLDVLGPEDQPQTIFRKAWEAIVGAAGAVLTNPKAKQVATKVPLQGESGRSYSDVLYAIFGLFRNAFVEAVNPALDEEIDIRSVKSPPPEEQKGFIRKVLGGKNKKEEPGEKMREMEKAEKEKMNEKEKKK